jgi:folate-dependent phosphoribosylglycinamide formyltransferase PurN
VLDDDTEAMLADRVLAQEHAIYPAALAVFASGGAAVGALPSAALVNPLPL